jgi:hypothetical protein
MIFQRGKKKRFCSPKEKTTKTQHRSDKLSCGCACALRHCVVPDAEGAETRRLRHKRNTNKERKKKKKKKKLKKKKKKKKRFFFRFFFFFFLPFAFSGLGLTSLSTKICWYSSARPARSSTSATALWSRPLKAITSDTTHKERHTQGTVNVDHTHTRSQSCHFFKF